MKLLRAIWKFIGDCLEAVVKDEGGYHEVDDTGGLGKFHHFPKRR